MFIDLRPFIAIILIVMLFAEVAFGFAVGIVISHIFKVKKENKPFIMPTYKPKRIRGFLNS